MGEEKQNKIRYIREFWFLIKSKKGLKFVSIFSGIIALVSAYIGLLPHGNNNEFLDNNFSVYVKNIYNSMGFFFGEFAEEKYASKGANTWLLIASIASPTSIGLAILYFIWQSVYEWYFLNIQARIFVKHFVICGLGNMGNELAKDLLNGTKLKDEGYSKLVIIESDEDNPHIENLRDKGAIVITGDATNKQMLRKAKVQTAKTIVLFTGNDLINLEILSNINCISIKSCRLIYIIMRCVFSIKQKIATVYIHLEDKKNQKLIIKSDFKNINAISFNIYSNIAQTLFIKHPLGNNVDTIKENNTVNLAIIGFEAVGDAILYRALNLGHFYNGIPLHVTVFTKNHKEKEKNFLKSYPISLNPKHECVQWNIEFKDEYELYQDDVIEIYNQFIFCKTESQENLSDAIKLRYNHLSKMENKEIYLFSDVYGNIIENNTSENINTFGYLKYICSYDIIVNEVLDEMAKITHNIYNETQKNPINWNDLDVFTKDSNRMQIEHLCVKLKAINKFLDKQYKNNTKNIIDNLTNEQIEKLAITEKKRWNAFHLLNGWKKLDTNIAKKQRDKKLHECLVSWDELDSVSKIFGNNYKKYDIQAILEINSLVLKYKKEKEHRKEEENSLFVNDEIIKFENRL